MLAGMARMPFWRFQIYSALGGLAWAGIIGIAGYVVGSNLSLIGSVVQDVGLGSLALVILAIVIALLAGRRAARR
jgi:membrane-associated protein